MEGAVSAGPSSITVEQLRLLFDAAPVGIGLVRRDGEWVAVNPALCDLMGRTSDEIVGHLPVEFVHPDASHRESSDAVFDVKNGELVSLESRLVRPDGSTVWVRADLTHCEGLDGQQFTIVHFRDLSEQRWAALRLAESEENLHGVAEVLREIHAGMDARRTIVTAGCRLSSAASVSLWEPDFDRSVIAVTASSEASLVGVEIDLEAAALSAHVFRGGEPILVTDLVASPLISPRMAAVGPAESAYAVPVMVNDVVGGVLSVGWRERISTLDDQRASIITLLAHEAGVALRQATLLDELERAASTDSLTGLPNRRAWDQRLGSLLARSGRRLTVALADLDHFKAYNDEHGHLSGDLLLKEFATAARSVIRAADSMCRWGGEEFVFALPDCSESDARMVLDRLLGSVPNGQTISIGYATWDGAESPEQLVTRADRALYEAKGRGRDRIVAFTSQ